MPTRRDQLQAYRFQNRRALAALVTGDPNVIEPPMRRLTVTTLSGIMIAILVAAGFAVSGLVKPATEDWKADGAVIITNETAAIYVRIDGVLHPVLNYASAVLAVSGKQQPKVVHVDRHVLDGAKRGSTIGVAGLPSSLPSAGDLVAAPFTVCSRTQVASGTTLTATVSVEIGDSLGATPVPADTGVVVRSAGDGADYLLTGGRRLAIGSSQIETSLQLDTSQILTVGTAFLNGVRAGTPLRTPTVAGAGMSYPTRVAGQAVAVGQLLYNRDDRRYLLVLADGVAGLTDVQARLLETLRLPPRNAVAAPVEVSRSDVINLPQSTQAWPVVAQQFTGLPTGVPRTSAAASSRGGVCVLYRGNSATPELAVPPSLPTGYSPSYSLPRVSQSALSARGIADSVEVSDGEAAVVRSSDRSATTFLIAEPGKRYPAASSDVLAGFGYADVKPAIVPAQLLALIPAGSALDPAAARTPTSN